MPKTLGVEKLHGALEGGARNNGTGETSAQTLGKHAHDN